MAASILQEHFFKNKFAECIDFASQIKKSHYGIEYIYLALSALKLNNHQLVKDCFVKIQRDLIGKTPPRVLEQLINRSRVIAELRDNLLVLVQALSRRFDKTYWLHKQLSHFLKV